MCLNPSQFRPKTEMGICDFYVSMLHLGIGVRTCQLRVAKMSLGRGTIFFPADF